MGFYNRTVAHVSRPSPSWSEYVCGPVWADGQFNLVWFVPVLDSGILVEPVRVETT